MVERDDEITTRDANRRLALLHAVGTFGALDWDVRTGEIAWSGPILDVLGVARRHFDGTYEALVQLVHDDDRPAVERAFAEVLAGFVTELDAEFRVVDPDSERARWVRMRGSVASDAGRNRRIVGVVVDITAKREAAERRHAIARAEKLQALGQLATGVAHDVNQSLALIAGYGGLLRAALDESPPNIAALREMCEIVGNAAIDGGKTVQRLLTFARGQAPDPPEMIGVVDLLHEVAQLTAPRWRTGAGLAGRPIGVTVDGDRDAMVHGAPSALREALINLVFNAIDAMPKGGVIALTARRVGTDVVVEVADSGDGMPAAVRTRIFEPFFTTKGELGTGLGLVQVRAIVQQHQGTIAVESRRGRGTTFRIALPWAPTTVPQPIESSAAAPRPASRRVLVVDDEAKLRTVTAKILRHRGLDTVEAASGEEALGHLALATFDVVVSDLGMAGGMSGWELAEEVKRRAPMTRFVLATGWGAEIDSEDARARGVDAVIGKPYRPDDLVRLLSAG